MKVTLLGATGAVGGHFLNKALLAGHEVSALVRTPKNLEERPNLTVTKGDVASTDELSAVVSGADVVVSCLGNVKGVLIMEGAAETVLTAAAAQPVSPKCVFISSIGCGGTSWVVEQLLSLIGGRAGFADYDRADARITREGVVPYVLVRPAALKEKPGNGKFRVFQGDGTFARPIAKEDVAAFLLASISTEEWDGRGGVQLAGLK